MKFSNFIKEGEIDLGEALNSPVEFYMTDDTKMPNEIYAAYELNGTDYGMSLVRSQWAGTYIFNFYMIKMPSAVIGHSKLVQMFELVYQLLLNS